MDVVPVLVGWTLWFGATAVILRVDAARQRAAAEARGEADFAQRSPAAYLGLALLCGPMPLLVYFWATRKSAAGALLGLAWAAAVTLLVGGVVVGVENAAAPAAPAFEPAIEAVRTWTPPDTPASSDFASTYLPVLREVAARARPLCAKHPDPPVDNAPSPAKGTTLEADPRVVSVEVWCVISAGQKVGFARLKEVPEARLLGGIWPQDERTVRDGEGRGTLTILRPSGAIRGADRLRYESDADVEVDLDVAAR